MASWSLVCVTHQNDRTICDLSFEGRFKPVTSALWGVGSQSIVCIRVKWPYHLSSKGCPASYSSMLNKFIPLTSLKKPICNLNLIGKEGKGERESWNEMRYTILQRQGWSQVDWVQYDGQPVTQPCRLGKKETHCQPTQIHLPNVWPDWVIPSFGWRLMSRPAIQANLCKI